MRRKRVRFFINIFLGVLAAAGMMLDPVRVRGAGEVYAAYQEYEARFAQIRTIADIQTQGYMIVEKHVFDVPLVSYHILAAEEMDTMAAAGVTQKPEALWENTAFAQVPTEVVRPIDPYKINEEDAVAQQNVPTVRFYCGLDQNSHRAAVFLADAGGNIVYKTNQLECNYTILGQLEQPIYDMVSAAFQDLNGDGLTDIILIAGCEENADEGTVRKYKVGEVLFRQANSSPGGNEVLFYRDWRINDKLNRFSMNQSAKSIRSFVRDGRSTEFLYTASTMEELTAGGFKPIKEQVYERNYEKLGTLKIFPGIFSHGDYDIFMIYMINEQGDIVWSFQPMGDYDNLYALKGMSAADLDGDGMKDLLVAARYSKEGDDGELIIENRFSIYYQRTVGFEQDVDFEKEYGYKDDMTVNGLVSDIRAYWGWRIDPEINMSSAD